MLDTYFQSSPYQQAQSPIPKIEGNQWTPTPSASSDPIYFALSVELEEFINACKQKLINFPFRSTLSPTQRVTNAIIQRIRERNDIVIKPADKNLGPVIMHPDTYHKYCMKILSDTDTYQPIDYSTINESTNIPTFIKQGYLALENILKAHNLFYNGGKRTNQSQSTGQLSKLTKSLTQLQTNERLRPTAIFYLTMKMHKPTISGRPIVNCRFTMTYHASVYLDNILKPIVKKLPTVVHNTIEVLLKVEHLTVTPHSTIFCADIQNLYPSIPHEYGIQAVKSIMQQHKLHNIEFHLDLLHWVLTNNYISYQNQTYLQSNGTAMGTPCAPNYANIVLYYLESSIINSFPRGSIQLYCRFLDDLFIVFENFTYAQDYNQRFNVVHPKIKLSWENDTSPKCGVFLDLTLQIQGNRITTKLYQKPTNKYLYIPTTTAHHRHIIVNFIQNELKRYKLYCSDPNDENSCRILFYKRLLSRGYPSSFLLSIFERYLPPRVLQLHQIRQSWNQPKITEKRPVFITNLPSLSPDQLKYIKKSVIFPATLRRHPIMAQVYNIPKGKPIVSHKLGKNINYLLTIQPLTKRKTTESSDEANFDTGDPSPKRTRTN